MPYHVQWSAERRQNVTSLSSTAVIRRAAGVESNRFERGTLLIDKTSGDVFELNETGSEVWQLIAGGTSLSSILLAMAEQHAVPASVLEADVRSLLESLKGAKLLEIDDERDEQRR